MTDLTEDVNLLNQWLADCLVPGPCCRNWDMHMWERVKGPHSGHTSLVPVLRTVSRNSEDMEAA
jgi:hypothetical protein